MADEDGRGKHTDAIELKWKLQSILKSIHNTCLFMPIPLPHTLCLAEGGQLTFVRRIKSDGRAGLQISTKLPRTESCHTTRTEVCVIANPSVLEKWVAESISTTDTFVLLFAYTHVNKNPTKTTQIQCM